MLESKPAKRRSDLCIQGGRWHTIYHAKLLAWEYDSIQRLSATVKSLDGVDSGRSMVMMEEDYKARQEECKQLVANRHFDRVKRNEGYRNVP